MADGHQVAGIDSHMDYARKQVAPWAAAGVTMMVVTGRNAAQIRELAGLI